MTFTVESEDLFVVRVTGTMTFADLKQFEHEARTRIDHSKKLKALAMFGEFTGWGKEGDWGDLSFMLEHDPFIEKIAVMTKAKWKDQLAMFLGAGRRQAQVKFFIDSSEQEARDWLQSESE